MYVKLRGMCTGMRQHMTKGKMTKTIAARVTGLALVGTLAFFCAVTGTSAVWAADYSEPPEILAPSAILISADTGEVLYEKDADLQLEPASLTKIMTALLAIERLSPDQIVTIDDEVANVTENEIYLRVGEEISVNDLLYALMLPSANDAAVALAKAVSGSVEAFAEQMDARAAEIGATNTHFVNANGLTTYGHMTTARDMALITQEAMNNEYFRQIVGTYDYLIEKTNRYGERYLKNRNVLLTGEADPVLVYGELRAVLYDGITGVKTGQTKAAGRCFSGAATRDGLSYIVIVLGDDLETNDVYADAISLLDYAFYGFRYVTLFGEGCGADIPVVKGLEESVHVYPVQQMSLTMTVAGADAIEYEYSIPDDLKAPVEEGVVVGSVKVWSNGVMLGETELATEAAVEKAPNFFEQIGLAMDKLSFGIKVGAVVLVALIVIFIVVIVRHALGRRYGNKYKLAVKESKHVQRIRRVR